MSRGIAPSTASPAHGAGQQSDPILAALPERSWVDYLRKLEPHRQQRRMVWARLSLLKPENRRDKQQQQALGTFDPLIRHDIVKPFLLSNADIALFFKDEAQDQVESALAKLRFLFNDDPLLIAESRGAPSRFLSRYHLGVDFAAVLALAEEQLAAEHHRRTVEQASSFANSKDHLRRPSGIPLTPRLLEKLEAQLARSDLSNMMRRQTACAIVGRAAPQPLFRELYISLSAVREALVPDVDLDHDPWLRQHLTAVLDRRVLFLLNQRDDRTLQTDISLNMNVESILSEDFMIFDENTRRDHLSGITIELQMMDIFADLGAYLFARDYLHQRGYRVCIDGARIESLPMIDIARLEADLIKILWDPLLTPGVLPDGTRLTDFVQRCGPSRVILCRCESQEAISQGQSFGITLFQGQFVDRLLSIEQKRTGTFR